MQVESSKEIHFDEHEVHITFNADAEAVAFQEWLETEGKERFETYYRENIEEYQ